MRQPNRFPALLIALLAAILALAACSDSGDEATTAGADADADATDDGEAMADEAADGEAMVGEFPATIDTAAGKVVIEAQPERIVSMSSTATEMVFAIGAGEQVAAVDSFSNYPAEAPITDLSAFEPNLEGIASYEPDLVLLGFGNEEIEAGLADLAVPVLVLPPAVTLDDTYDQIAQLGMATGHIDGAADLNAEIRAGIDDVVASAPEATDPVRVYHELDETFFSATSSSFIGQLYDLLGFENVADPADPDGTNSFPQLQVDQIIQGDPTLIVFTDAYTYGADDIAARPGWDSLSAVANDNIVQVDADVASRWGPRIVDFLQVIVDATAAVPAG